MDGKFQSQVIIYRTYEGNAPEQVPRNKKKSDCGEEWERKREYMSLEVSDARLRLHTTFHRRAGIKGYVTSFISTPARGCITRPFRELDVCSWQWRQRIGAVLHSEKANVALGRRTGLTSLGLAGIPRICQGRRCLSVSWEPNGGYARVKAKVGSSWTLSNRAT